MTIQPETVRQVAGLARIALDDADLAAQCEHFQRLLSLVEIIAEADTSAVAPMVHPLDLYQRLRVDQAAPAPGAEPLMRLAPDHADDHYLVPRVIE